MELLKALRKENIETFLGIFENESNAHLGIAAEARKYISNIKTFPCRGKLDIRSIWHLRKFLDSNNIDIIHSHKYKTNVYSLLASVSRKIPLVSTCHNWLSENYKMKFYEWLDKRILNKFDKVIAVSDDIKDKILKSGISYHKVLKIKNGVCIEKYSDQNRRKIVRAKLGINDDKIIIGNVGRLDRNKGLTYLLRAAKLLLNEFENVVFLIVGEGPSLQELHDETERLGIRKKVIFTGYRNDIPSIFSAIDIFVLPSLIEGLPMVLLEAMASKKPVVATKAGDIPAVITHNESGLLIESGDTEQMKNALTYFLIDRKKLSLIAEKGFEIVKNGYSSERMAKEYIEVYRSLLQKRSRTI